MSNGEVCCILGICCPPAAARVRLIAEFQKVSGYDGDGCEKIADFLLDRVALAPKSLEPVIQEIVHATRAHPPEAL